MQTPATEKPGIYGGRISTELFWSILETSLAAPIASHKLTFISLPTKKNRLFYLISLCLGTSHQLMKGPALELSIITSGKSHRHTSCLPLSK